LFGGEYNTTSQEKTADEKYQVLVDLAFLFGVFVRGLRDAA